MLVCSIPTSKANIHVGTVCTHTCKHANPELTSFSLRIITGVYLCAGHLDVALKHSTWRIQFLFIFWVFTNSRLQRGRVFLKSLQLFISKLWAKQPWGGKRLKGSGGVAIIKGLAEFKKDGAPIKWPEPSDIDWENNLRESLGRRSLMGALLCSTMQVIKHWCMEIKIKK